MKKFSIFKQLKFNDPNEWKEFAKNIEKIQFLKIKVSDQNFDVETILKNLHIFENLVKFECSLDKFNSESTQFIVNMNLKSVNFCSNASKEMIEIFKKYFKLYDWNEFPFKAPRIYSVDGLCKFVFESNLDDFD